MLVLILGFVSTSWSGFLYTRNSVIIIIIIILTVGYAYPLSWTSAQSKHFKDLKDY